MPGAKITPLRETLDNSENWRSGRLCEEYMCLKNPYVNVNILFYKFFVSLRLVFLKLRIFTVYSVKWYTVKLNAHKVHFPKGLSKGWGSQACSQQ